MIVGTADVVAMAESAQTIAAWPKASTELEAAECFQLASELRLATRETALPPSLHPTTPPVLSVQVWSVGESPWGPFSFAHTRISCRSGVRPRGFTTGAVASTPGAAAGMSERFGYPCRVAPVELHRRFDGVDVVTSGLAIRTEDPQPMRVGDVQYTSTVNLAHSPAGLRLVQVEPRHHSDRVERLGGKSFEFSGAEWGNPELDPYHFVSASIATGRIVIPPIRFVCRPFELAFSGTEIVP